MLSFCNNNTLIYNQNVTLRNKINLFVSFSFNFVTLCLNLQSQTLQIDTQTQN